MAAMQGPNPLPKDQASLPSSLILILHTGISAPSLKQFTIALYTDHKNINNNLMKPFASGKSYVVSHSVATSAWLIFNY